MESNLVRRFTNLQLANRFNLGFDLEKNLIECHYCTAPLGCDTRVVATSLDGTPTGEDVGLRDTHHVGHAFKYAEELSKRRLDRLFEVHTVEECPSLLRVYGGGYEVSECPHCFNMHMIPPNFRVDLSKIYLPEYFLWIDCFNGIWTRAVLERLFWEIPHLVEAAAIVLPNFGYSGVEVAGDGIRWSSATNAYTTLRAMPYFQRDEEWQALGMQGAPTLGAGNWDALREALWTTTKQLSK